ncbi:G-protein coupled receptor 143-like [Periplaneta americana]|uniref:G-protein coupled receptor 143-like n=1 Tax=Periplaneta americana TaxID=6978 RepID=UPI0037E7CC33
MADPTIQTFCCHRPNTTDSPVNFLMEFHSDLYNTVCVASSLLGIAGAIYQILPRRISSTSNRSFGFSVRGRQIIVWLAVADLMAAMGVFVRSILWIYYKQLVPAFSNELSSVIFCAVSSAWIQFFYTATWFWTLCYALHVRLTLKAQRESTVLYHITAWISPALLTSMGLLILYVPDANCHNINTLSGALTHILPNYCATLLPMFVIMIANPALYCCSTQDVKKNVFLRLGQITQKERSTVDGLKLKFIVTTLTFYMCWLPNLICGVLLWSLWIDLPKTAVIILWYIMAVMNPLQALLNSMVYRRWSEGIEQIYFPCLSRSNPDFISSYSHRNSADPIDLSEDENTSLLQSHDERLPTNRMSINGSSMYT